VTSGGVSLEGKVALITGATSGVGRAIAKGWAARGAAIVATGRRHELGKSLEYDARQAGGRLTFVRADVRSDADCAVAVKTAVDEFGRLDILVNNAGVEGPVADFHCVSEAQWDEVLDINLKGAFFCSQHAIQQMLHQGDGGVLLHMASINAVEALAHMAPYNVSKAALVQLARTIAVEYLFNGIRSNAIILGGAEGETARRTQDGLARFVRGDAYVRPPIDDAMEQVVMQRAEDVAGFLALLVSEEARLLTGATVALDRAMTAGLTASMAIHMTTAGLWGTQA
jgi:NAD(P)-dependent dehydrogenase (short-subunit alcohol dehydrogenase family)